MEGLILVDLQNDYFCGGRMELVDTAAAAVNARRLLNTFREERAPVIHIQHISSGPGASFFLPETRGAEIHEMVAPLQSEVVLVKHYPNSFRDTSLLGVLHEQELSDLVICGAMSHMCIDATVRAAFDFGFNCVVAEDACATRDLAFNDKLVKAADVHISFMAALSAVYAKVASTDAILQARRT
jgi:nicotinamidase-related amidase